MNLLNFLTLMLYSRPSRRTTEGEIIPYTGDFDIAIWVAVILIVLFVVYIVAQRVKSTK